MSRREARKHAFSLIFQYPFHDFNTETLDEASRFYFDGLETGGRLSESEFAYVGRVTEGVLRKTPELDAEINTYLKDWELARISRADLAILRLGAYELLFEPGIPAGAAVNEAVEMAKAFGADESPAFINGVLGGISRSRRPGEAKEKPRAADV